MTKIFYFGMDNNIYGPHSEEVIQMWYVKGFFSSAVVFQISESDEFNPEHPSHTLADLIELNGRILPFHSSTEEKKSKKLEEAIKQMKQEIESIRKSSQRADRQAGDRDIITAVQAQVSSLLEEIESLRKSGDRQSEDRDIITALQTQVTSLLESHADLVKRLDSLSNQRDNSPAKSQLEKRVGDLKKRVDEQEKTVTSMRKELSAVNSKCDRNEFSLQKLIEKQSSTETAVTGYDKRISDLKSAEKSIRESLKSCENTASSSSEQLKSITNELTKVKTDIESQKKESSNSKDGLRMVRDDISKMNKDLKNHWDNILDMENDKDDIKKEIDTLNDSIFCIQEHLNMHPSEEPSSAGSESENVAEKEADIPAPVKADSKKEKKEELPVKSEVKKEEKVPDEPVVTAEVKEEEEEVALGEKEEEKPESAPWDVKSDVAAKVEKKEEFPWSSAKEVKEKEREPWNDVSAVESRVEESPWNSKSAVSKVERAPWDEQPTIDEKDEKKEEEPWNTEKEKEKTTERPPWEDAPKAFELREKENKEPWNDKKAGVELEPWNETKTDSGKAKKEAVPTAQQAGNGLSSGQKDGKPEPVKSEKATAAEVKPVSRVKDWNAICREFSDSEEEVEEVLSTRLPKNSELNAWSANFIRDMTELLILYSGAIETNLILKFPNFDFNVMREFYLKCHRTAPHFGLIRQELLNEMRKLASLSVYCVSCGYTITTPRQMLYHFTDAAHLNHMPQFLTQLLGGDKKYADMGTAIAQVFHHFLEDTEAAIARERAATERAKPLMQGLIRQEDCRPTVQMMTKIAGDLSSISLSSTVSDPAGSAIPMASIRPGEEGRSRRDVVASVRAFFADPAKKRAFERDFEQHVAEGKPACASCSLFFDSVQEYYKHMTTYEHTMGDDTIFGLCMRIWKGNEYWNAML